jgi:hypothetical protein
VVFYNGLDDFDGSLHLNSILANTEEGNILPHLCFLDGVCIIAETHFFNDFLPQRLAGEPGELETDYPDKIKMISDDLHIPKITCFSDNPEYRCLLNLRWKMTWVRQ